MFAWFERRLNPFPSEEPGVPPKGLVAFCWHFTKPAAPWLAIMAVCSMLIAVGEVMLFRFLGNIVDWLSNADRATFLADEGGSSSGMARSCWSACRWSGILHTIIMHQVLARQLPDDRPLADASLPAAPFDDLLCQRVCRARRRPR